jgi:integrase
VKPSARNTPDALCEFWARSQRPESNPQDLRQLARRFIELKGILGHRYQRDARTLALFISFEEAGGVRQPQDLTSDALLAWSASRACLSPPSRQRENLAVRAFLAHLHAIGRIPAPLAPPPIASGSVRYRPYLFSVQELLRIFCRENTPQPARDRRQIYRTMYACALRASEATRLRLRDFDARQGILFIRQSKFYKDRLIPLHPRILALLQSRRSQRRAVTFPDAPLFANPRGRAWDSSRLANLFRADLVDAGLYRPARVVGNVRFGAPRLHSLRHTFAVQRLLRWYREGADVQAKLPLLSTYMGHSHIRHTQVYLTITAEILGEARQRFAGRWEKEFPLQP